VRWLAEARRHAWAIGGLAAVTLVAVGTFIWQAERTTTPPRAKASIAVLPLDTFEDDPATKRLARGLTEDIITDLSRFGDLEIVASDSAKASKEKSQDVGAIGRELGVAYLLQGAIQHEATTYRVTAKLVDASTGAYVWSQRWDYAGNPSLDVQGEIAERVAATLGSQEASAALTGSEIRKAKSRPPANLAAYDLYLLAVEARGKFTKEDIFGGIDLATKAIALDPGFARAYGTRARLHFNTITYGTDFETAMQAMEVDARKAVDLAPNDAESRAALAWYYAMRGRNKDAETELRTALAANPANISLMKMAAATYTFSGHAEEGAALADKVLRLDPLANSGTLNTIKDAYFFARRFEDTVTVISRVPPDARSRGARLLLAMSLALLGRKDELKQARDELLKAHPNMSAELLLNQGWKFDRAEDQKFFLDGFAAVGLPLCATDADLAKINKPERLPGCPS
jgi:TolB-like protein/Flp pilus assembly protein TadD